MKSVIKILIKFYFFKIIKTTHNYEGYCAKIIQSSFFPKNLDKRMIYFQNSEN